MKAQARPQPSVQRAMKHIALALLALAACAPDFSPEQPLQAEPLPQAEPTPELQPDRPLERLPELASEPQPEPLPERVLYLDPEPALLHATELACQAYADRFGLRVQIREGGVSLRVQAGVTYKSQPVDAVASYSKWCAFDGCDATNSSIVFAEELTQGKSWALNWTVLHEIGHLVSGWGRGVEGGMHLPELAGAMAPGCRNRVCPSWSEADVALICAHAPCEEISL